MHDEGGQDQLPMDYRLLDHLLEGCQVIGPDWRYVYINKAAADHGRATPEKLIGRTMMEAYPGIDATPMFEALRTCMVERIPQELENEFAFGDGSTGWFELRVEPVPAGVFILSIDVTSRHRAEQALRSSREDYRNLVENLQDVVYSLDAKGRFVYVSPAVERFELNAEALRGTPFVDLVVPDDTQRLGEALAGALRGEPESLELRLVDGQGKLRHVRCSCRAAARSDGPAALTGLLHDMTEQRRMQTQLHASQRLETVGRLAGGIAHDFNNLLSVVLTYAGFAIKSLREGDPLRADIEEIHTAGTRAAALTRQLLALGRKQVLQPEAVRLDQVVEGMESMLGRLLGEDIEVQVVRTDALGITKVDPGRSSRLS